jgi:hypothetical protein
MFNTIIPLDLKMTFRDKARLNICIAKDLAENFGGRKADYLKRLNRKLRMRIAFESNHFAYYLAKAA